MVSRDERIDEVKAKCEAMADRVAEQLEVDLMSLWVGNVVRDENTERAVAEAHREAILRHAEPGTEVEVEAYPIWRCPASVPTGPMVWDPDYEEWTTPGDSRCQHTDDGPTTCPVHLRDLRDDIIGTTARMRMPTPLTHVHITLALDG